LKFCDVGHGGAKQKGGIVTGKAFRGFIEAGFFQNLLGEKLDNPFLD
jgi:hypothetical protein